MGNGVNKVIILGRLGQDPKVHDFDTWKKTSISVATSDSWIDKKTGDLTKKTEWHNISFTGPLADVAEKYLHKGSQVYVEGSLKTRQYEKDGIKKYATEIAARTLQMLGSKESNKNENQNSYDENPFDQDIPF